jgi:hypothetical protein
MIDIRKVRAKRVKRSPVAARDEAEAADIRRRWQIEDAIRDLDARVIALADYVNTKIE